MFNNKFKLMFLLTIIAICINTKVLTMQPKEKQLPIKEKKIGKYSKEALTDSLDKNDLETFLHIFTACPHYKNINLKLNNTIMKCSCGCTTELTTTYIVNILHAACIKGNLNIVKYLIEKIKMDPKSLSNNGFTPLFYACINGHLEIVKYLLENHVSFHDLFRSLSVVTINYNEKTCLKNFRSNPNNNKNIRISHYEIIKCFAKKNILDYIDNDLPKLISERIQKLYDAITNGKQEDFDAIINILEKNFSTVYDLLTFFYAHAIQNPIKIAYNVYFKHDKTRFMIKERKIEEAEEVDEEYLDALQLACQYSNIHAVDYFINNKNVNPHNYDASKYPLINLAKNKDILNYILQMSDYDGSEQYGEITDISGGYATQTVLPPVHHFSLNGNLDNVKDLIELYEFDPKEEVNIYCDHTYCDGDISPIISALNCKNKDIIEYLTNLKDYNIKLNDINNNFSFYNVFKNHNFLEYILKKIKTENDGKLNLNYLIDSNGDTLISFIINNPEIASEILCKKSYTFLTNFSSKNPNSLISRLLSNKTTELEGLAQGNDVLKLFLEALKSIKSKFKAEKTPEDKELNNHVKDISKEKCLEFSKTIEDTLIIFNMITMLKIPKFNTTLTRKNPTNRKEKYLKEEYKNAMCDDTASEVMQFMGNCNYAKKY